MTITLDNYPYFKVLDQDTYFEFQGEMYPCKNFHTIAREDNMFVFAVLRRSWILIRYEESVDEADVLAKRLFEKSSLKKLSHEYNLMNNGAECFMKFWDKDFITTPVGEDYWLPVVCIFNNYNGTGALRYDFGFQIKDFESNIIFEDLNINLKVNHTIKGKNNIYNNLSSKLDNIEFKSKTDFINRFIKKVKKLINQSLGKSEVFPLVLKFLNADIKEKSKKTTKDIYKNIKKELDSLFDDCDKLNIYNFMKEMSKFIETTTTLSDLKKDDDENDDEENLNDTTIIVNTNPQPLSWQKKLKMQKQLGAFINRIIKEVVEHKDENGELDPLLIKDWIGDKYFKMTKFII